MATLIMIPLLPACAVASFVQDSDAIITLFARNSPPEKGGRGVGRSHANYGVCVMLPGWSVGTVTMVPLYGVFGYKSVEKYGHSQPGVFYTVWGVKRNSKRVAHFCPQIWPGHGTVTRYAR